MNELIMLTVPFSIIGIPSFETASIKAYLESEGKRVRVEHLHLNFAETLGAEEYRFLRITDVGQGIFAALLHDEQYEGIKAAYSKAAEYSKYEFDILLRQVKEIADNQIEKLLLERDSKILFYLYSQQLLPALYYAKKIKELYQCEIWFAGYHCNEKLADGLRKSYSFIDKVFHQDYEEQILAYMNQEVAVYRHENMDFLPTPDYSDFIKQAQLCGEKFKQDIIQTPYFQVEFARGCWWNQCTFCTLNCKYSTFRERSIEVILEDYKNIICRYKTLKILVYEFVNNHNWREILEALLQKYPGLYGSFDFNFKVSTTKKYEDFVLLKKAGASILVGTENFDYEYLEKMNKGQKVIENILFLKYAERSGVACYHNLMYGMPYEEEKHLERNKQVISYIYHLPPPFDEEEFRLTYDSEVYRNPEKYGIKQIIYRHDKEEIWFPNRIKEHYKPFFYDFISCNEGLEARKEKWSEVINTWRKIYYQYAEIANPKQVSMLSMKEAEDILQIDDIRYGGKATHYVLEGIEKELYQYCDEIRTMTEILEHFGESQELRIREILNKWEEKKIIFQENGEYLSLAI